MSRYGYFTTVVNRLDNYLAEVSSCWTDNTGFSYLNINENVKVYLERIYSTYCESVSIKDSFNSEYNLDEYKSRLSHLESRVSQL